MILALAITALMGSPIAPLGGDASFAAHLKALEAQFEAEPQAADALRLIQGAGRMGQIEAVGRWIRAARAHGVAAGHAHLVGGLAYLRAKDYERAIIKLYQVCLDHPHNGAAHVGLWRSYTEAEVLPSTVDVEGVQGLLVSRGYFVSAKRPPRPDLNGARQHTDAGMSALHGGRFDEAVEHFEKALSVHRGHAEAYRGLGAAHARSKRKVKALAAHRLYLALAGGDTRHIRRVRRQVNDAERHRGRKRPKPIRQRRDRRRGAEGAELSRWGWRDNSNGRSGSTE